MKTPKILTITLIALTLSANNFAFSKTKPNASANLNVAVVDIPKLLESSPEISALKTSRKNDMEVLTKFVEDAKADITKETNEFKKKTLENKYNDELNLRKVNLDKEYSKKISDYDKNITFIISKKAKSLGYNLVLTKSSVINGGTDITGEIIKELK